MSDERRKQLLGTADEAKNVMDLGNTVGCHRCGRQGLIAPNCPQRFTYHGGGQSGRNGACKCGNGRPGGGTRFGEMDSNAETKAMDVDSEQQLESNDISTPQLGN